MKLPLNQNMRPKKTKKGVCSVAALANLCGGIWLSNDDVGGSGDF
jgi:hypothetical protein